MGFSFGGVTSQSQGITARLTSWQATPDLRNQTVTIPGKPGVADFGADTDKRLITIKCNIYPQTTMAKLVAVLDSVAAWLAPDNGLQPLVLDDVPDRYFMARLQDAIDCDRLTRTAGSFDLKFLCPDPYGYAIADEEYQITTTGTHTIARVKGNAPSNPSYALKGINNGGQIIIETNGIGLPITGILTADETLIIDSGLVTAKVVNAAGLTVRNGLPLIGELNFPILQPGTNQITITAENATFTNLAITAKSRWR